jgi:UDP-N-acetylmuramate dehydrogenase
MERAGYARGYCRGQAAISSRHSLALINRGKATASEIVGLMREIQSGVLAAFEVELKPEPVFVGFEREKYE